MTGTNEADLIDQVFEMDGNYGDDLNYDIFPEPGTDGYNSNSYLHGLLEALSAEHGVRYTVNFGQLAFPGWDKPLELTVFGIEN